MIPGCRSHVIACLAALTLVEGAAAQTWTTEDGSRIRFTASQEGAPIDGGFEDFIAEIVFDPEDLDASRVTVEIDTASITSGHKDRDTTLRSAAFFDVQTWPKARFASEKLAHQGGDRYEAQGRLTIRDVTEEVILPFDLVLGDHPEHGDRWLAEASGELTISRLDYGIGQGEWASTKTVGEDVVIRIEIVASAPR